MLCGAIETFSEALVKKALELQLKAATGLCVLVDPINTLRMFRGGVDAAWDDLLSEEERTNKLIASHEV